MNLSQLVAPHLPYLRRFARALTGSQTSGDSYVAALLETLIADPSSIREAADVRLALYQGFCKLWSSVSLNHVSDSSMPGWEQTVQSKLSQMQGPARQLFLLMTVEGFDRFQAAEILGKSPDSVEELFNEANSQISNMISSGILIIEDEPLIALDIEEIITSLGHRAIGVARTHSEAVKLAAEKNPQLILSDIQLADGSSGIDAVNEILKSFDVPVIFITAFPERLLTGTRPEPAFLITKPFSHDMVKAVIAQALFFDMRPSKAA
jgi:CheY-like chemotaxis protein